MPESTEALVERVRAYVAVAINPPNGGRLDALAALTELTERLAAAEKAATGSAWGYWRSRAEAAERERDEECARYDQLITDLGGTLP